MTRLWSHYGSVGLVCLVFVLIGCGGDQSTKAPSDKSASDANEAVARPEAVAALGQLEPAGDVRRLAAPTAGVAGTPRIEQLLVDEGAVIRRGQVLARFDTKAGLEADLAAVEADLASLEDEIALQKVEVSRYSRGANWGAVSLVQRESSREDLVRLEGEQAQALARRQGLLVDLEDSELVSPLDGLVLEIHAREGERPGSDGVMDIGASQKMQARIEVYESDIAQINLDQQVQLTSENGGFSGQLSGRVIQISPRVQQRDVLSTDPTGDADARVVEVLVALDDADVRRVIRLAGLKVIARFEP
ncbi:HlyD family efflux transporter periplasmic adaptor subunit [Parasynechococcus marenigrum]|uniref:Possible ABC transporter component n=1 Tax=Parasynechococcus marenigrum (strain WH8102) TaxID=84588 RepID=Q7U7A0_PARMW|nr:HlyD family efflux transporter periplasmic adaptor subunit [Parasynechococcus marenigrum]CAE07600.1 possible ABC transporter component [Parasynechococcus marenigrum WH 8102]